MMNPHYSNTRDYVSKGIDDILYRFDFFFLIRLMNDSFNFSESDLVLFSEITDDYQHYTNLVVSIVDKAFRKLVIKTNSVPFRSMEKMLSCYSLFDRFAYYMTILDEMARVIKVRFLPGVCLKCDKLLFYSTHLLLRKIEIYQLISTNLYEEFWKWKNRHYETFEPSVNECKTRESIMIKVISFIREKFR